MSAYFRGRRLWVALSTLLIIALFLAFSAGSKNQTKSTGVRTPSQAKKTSQTKKITFVAMGDMLAHDSIVAQAKTASGYDFQSYFKDIRPLYKNADVVFCNPETISVAPEFGLSGYPTFNAPKEFATGLTEGAGCNLINLATNHINDKHQPGIDANLALWEKQKTLAFTGSSRSTKEQNQIKYFTKKGVKVAFLAFADYSNDPQLSPYGLNVYHNKELFGRLTKQARANADAVVLSMHWGTEGSNGANQDQLDIVKLANENGVDVIIGTGPHVLQKVSWVNSSSGQKTLVWYSIGNMLSSQLKPNELTSVIAGFDLEKTPTGVKISNLNATPTYMSYDWTEADRASDKLEMRKNFRLRSLAQSGKSSEEMFGKNYSASERKMYIQKVLGNETDIVLR